MPIVGDVLAERYRIDAPLGAGGMASVWRAHDLRLERDVAVKILAGNLAGDPVVAERFEREARSLAASSHPNVVAVYDVERGDRSSGREPFYVMELCDGGSLADRLEETSTRRMTPGELVPILVPVADGLASLHERGVVHRDVKPHNILLCGGRAKLADFGLARTEAARDLVELTATGMTVGTLAYMAPEVLDGEPATAAGDVYGLGVVAFQGLTGRLPRPSGSVAEVVAAREVPVPRASEAAPRLGRVFDPLLASALARDPGARPDARTFAAQLSAAAADEPRVFAPVANADAVTQSIPVPRVLAAAGGTAGPAAAASRRIPGPPSMQMPPPTGVQPAWARGRRDERRGVGGRLLAGLLLAVLAIGVLVALAAFLGNRGAGQASPPASVASASPSPSPTPSPSPSPSPSPTASPSPSPTPTPTPDPLAQVESARSDLNAVVDAAIGQGLKRRDARDIMGLADDAVSRLRAGDSDGARQRVAQVLEQVDRARRDVDDETAQALEDAAQAFASAVDQAIQSS